MRTGIFGGTFDPIHIAHLHVAECALHQFGLDRILLIPAGDPWQKTGRRVTAGQHRLEMTHCAADDTPGLEVDDREVMRPGLTFTIDTLEEFSNQEELFLILGADSYAGRATWHRWDDVEARVTVLVAPRPGIDLEGATAEVIDVSPLAVSGTEIRSRAATGKPFRYLVTNEVWEYVTSNRLYAKDPEGDMVDGSMTVEEQP